MWRRHGLQQAFISAIEGDAVVYHLSVFILQCTIDETGSSRCCCAFTVSGRVDMFVASKSERRGRSRRQLRRPGKLHMLSNMDGHMHATS